VRAWALGLAAVAVVAWAACSKREPQAVPPPQAAQDARGSAAPGRQLDAAGSAVGERCTQLPFAETLPVPEASGSALLPVDDRDALVVVADSGNSGAYVVVDPADGSVRERGELPLGHGASDDVEGLAVRDGSLIGLTSSGSVLRWQRAAGGGRFELVDGPYPIADPATGLSCDPRKVNCGKNYEGICLRSGPVPAGECAGLAAAKADGALYCVVAADGPGGRLTATAASIAVASREMLTGCDLAPDGSVWAGTNLFGASTVYRITGWTHPDRAALEEIGQLGPGFPESIAVATPPADGGGGTIVYRFSDMGGEPSAVAKYRCRDAVR
jgi:hypothetical protein